ncbi:YciI family protein [Flexivirga caeni]|uniref:YCII-related domain-containing protein n=1 Tax=Flexivirga caeni TaxID=2294115 RepID=A0A3M9MI75_9MICO|nr:YciI family protein [Flexivirga caeni]RNI25280.1 hypothetical protein EFY87_01180 [Flexivirga caeni]
MTTYLVLLAGAENEWSDADPADRARWHQEHLTFGRVVGDAILGGEALAGVDTATTLRRRTGTVQLTDGPFAETAEQIGGFYLIEATDLDQVVTWCALLPEIYSIEIRPCIQLEGPEA